MPPFVDLNRRFHDLSSTELENPELLASLNDQGYAQGISWSELLQHRRVVILAEAGSGKTREMQEQAKRLVVEGRFAFFVPLELLDREPLANLLSDEQEVSFEKWKTDGQALAWFFLDAVDELKLTKGKLDNALLRFAKTISGHLGRARVLISCRPNDWRPAFDSATVQERLPVPVKPRRASPAPAEVLFLDALRRDRGGPALLGDKELEGETTNGLRTVIMLPMSERQIRLYAERCGIKDVTAFLTEVDRRDAWMFARRPLDLAELIEIWNRSGRLGTRAEQHEVNVAVKLKENPERPDRSLLSEMEARTGAMRLALALALTRTRTLRSPEQTLDMPHAEGILDPTAILPDWTGEKRQALLRRALFDPATYGRVRFHHRSVQEYLAACRLRALREKGMSVKALFRLLFAERYGVEVVFPSMQAIAAWLALWDDAVLRELMNREPEALLSLGDPESLNLSSRRQLLRAFVEEYGQGGWRGLNIPISEVRRLAHSDLAPLVRELWGHAPTNPDVRELLVELIWQGPIEGCADLAYSVAIEESNDYLRIAAIRALIACGREDLVSKIAQDLLSRSAAWPARVVHGIAADLFPKKIGVDDLISLMERTPESKRTVGGFDWVSRQIVEAIEPLSDKAISLRDKLADLVRRGRNPIQRPFEIKGKFDHLAPALAILCNRQINADPARVDSALIRACVTASRFGGRSGGRHEPVGILKAQFVEGELRRAAFWAELMFIDETMPSNDDWYRYYQAEQDSLIGFLTEADRPWLEEAVADESQPERRSVALHALINGWHQRGRIVSELGTLRAKLKGDVSLLATLETRTTPAKYSDETEESLRKLEQNKREHEVREAQRLEQWKKWREELIANPAHAFSPARLEHTVAMLYSWLMKASHERNHRYNVWDKKALMQVFGPEIAERAESAFRSLWRVTSPQLWSERPPEERHSTPYVWIYGLCGISAEAETPEWTSLLSPDEARAAAVYATLELNGFAPFIHDLVVAHPASVDAVIGGELMAQLTVGGNFDHLPVLQDLAYTAVDLKRLLSPRLLAALLIWPAEFAETTASRWACHLHQVLHILGETVNNGERQAIAAECSMRFTADPTGPLALVWLRGLFRFDAERGAQVLTVWLSTGDNPAIRQHAIAAFAGIFGGHQGVPLEIADPANRARVLGQLLRCAYTFVRPKDDRVHEGVYSPDTRDDAETARTFLLTTLLDTPGPESRRIILELATEPNFAHFSDRLRLLARQRAAMDAEFAPFDAEKIIKLENRYEIPPHDRDGLFTVMWDRLEDLAHEVAHHDLTDRRTLRRITDEVEMQRTLALRLHMKAKGAYIITREEEVADQKRTDIRFLAVRDHQKAVAEVKIADARWSLSELERALRNQLVGQYLRHESCQAGCLLLTYDGKKKYWINPDSNKRMTFSDMVAYLNHKAKELEAEKLWRIRLAVFGLDLTDPPLPTV